jgi:hypothetical protein
VFINFFYNDQTSTPFNYKILLERGPHHYAPGSWGIGIHIRMFIIICLAIYGARVLRYKLKDNILLVLSGIILFLCGLAVFFTEVFFNAFIVRLFFWRFVSFLMLFCYIYGAALIVDLLDRNRIQAKVGAGVLLVLYLSLAAHTSMALPYLIKYIGASLAVSLGIVIINAVLSKYNLKVKGAASLAILIFPFITFQLSGINQFNFGLDQIHPYKYEKNYEEVLAWVRTYTKPEDKFIIPPELEGFRLRAERAILVNWKCFPNGIGEEMKEWKRRMSVLKDYDKLTPERVKELAREYQMTYFLAPKPHRNEDDFLSQGFESTFQNKGYIVYKIPYTNTPSDTVSFNGQV